MHETIVPTTTAAWPAALVARLLSYLRALPDCRSVPDILRATAEGALALTEGLAAVAAGPTPEVSAAGAAGADLRARAQVAWQALAAPGARWAARPVRAPGTGDEPGLVIAPLSPGDRPYGVLAVSLAGPLTPALEEALAIVAQAAGQRLALQIGIGQTAQRLTELSMLYDVATALGAIRDPPQLLPLIVERTQAALRSQACTLMLLDETRQELIFEIPTGAAGRTLQQWRVPIGQGVCGWVARSGQPAIVNDPRSDPRFDSQVDQASGFQTRNVLCVPLQVRGRVSGVLEVLNKQDGAPYTFHDLDLLNTLAGQAAVAIDHAQLYTSLQSEHARLLEAEEQVRKELARDLHDGPAQQTAAICMQVEVLRKLLTRDPRRLPAELDALEALARKANRQVRTLQFQLRPVMLETRGLRAALEYYVNQLRETGSSEFLLDVVGCTGRLPAPLERAAFDIVQEALGNIRKHAAARRVALHMWRQPGGWIIRIVDDGRGFDVAAIWRSYETRGSLGLLNMRERAQAMGGKLELISAPGRGTTMTLEIPTTDYVPSEDSVTMPLEIPPEGLKLQ